MKTFNLGLSFNGDIQYILRIAAETLSEAKTEWARITGHLDVMWDSNEQTYMGWPVVEIRKKMLERKVSALHFGY